MPNRASETQKCMHFRGSGCQQRLFVEFIRAPRSLASNTIDAESLTALSTIWAFGKALLVQRKSGLAENMGFIQTPQPNRPHLIVFARREHCQSN